mmetsp:Transcript_34573/g.79015  ORF Transcript_34573/g.79015 Transcript_34573/m.79015 type:complete len:350 (-) Transcript_34573:8-1057(-)
MAVHYRRSLACLVALAVAPSTTAGAQPKATRMEQAIAKQYHDLHQCTAKKTMVSVGGKQRTVSYLDALPTSPKGTVVFFHGSVFTAKTWQIVGVLDALFAEGFRAIAMDWKGINSNGAKFAESFMAAVSPPVDTDSKLVIVAASAGGSMALPYVWTHADEVSGYISVAANNDFLKGQKGSKDVPLLVIYGDQDVLLHSSEFHKRFFSKWQKKIIQDAPHQCYLKDISAARLFNTWVTDFVSGKVTVDGVQIVARGEEGHEPDVQDKAIEAAKRHVQGGFGSWHWLVVFAGVLAMCSLYYCLRRSWRRSSSKNHHGILPTKIGKEDEIWKDDDDDNEEERQGLTSAAAWR